MPDIDFARLLIAFLVLLFSLTVHEAAHAWSADWLGDSTARRLGRISLNPAVHVDPIGTILFPLIAMLTGLPIIGWAKPVPVSILQLRGNWRQKFMVIAAAGPASNLVMAVLAAVALRLFAAMDGGGATVSGPVTLTLFWAVQLNVLLALFNMVPVPPLDGGNVLAGILRGPALDTFDRLRPYGFLIIYGLLLSGLLTMIVFGPADRVVRWLIV